MKRRLLFGATLALLAGGAWLAVATAPHAQPDYATLRDGYGSTEAYLLDRNGELLQTLRQDYGKRRLPWVTLADVSPALPAAIVQAEDRRFQHHSGVDLRALLGA